MRREKDSMEYLFKEQSKRVKRGIKNMENSMYNSTTFATLILNSLQK